VKANAVFVGFLRCPPGRHRAFVQWHDDDHRPENEGQIDHVYHSERWVAPPDLVSEQQADPAGLVPEPGQYLHTYWSTASPERLLADMTVVRERLRLLGRCAPINRDFSATWRDRMHPVAAHVGGELDVSVDALPLAPNDGIVASLLEVPRDGGETAGAYQRETDPALSATPGVLGHYTLMPMAEADHHLLVQLCFVRGDVQKVQRRVADLDEALVAAGGRIHVRASFLSTRPDRRDPYE
jgi:hypothetical protein